VCVCVCVCDMHMYVLCVCHSPTDTGGCAVTEELQPGFKFSRGAYLAGLFREGMSVCMCVCVYLHV
jgi:hypothetical protein